ncbi:MAG TPA: ABC transporter ATP-binding protein [Candidatus Saccharimonadales bacterium]|nr:ABC transporter ATP-binding protein [Candidatus Saccharimonadales bacterium]
MSTHWQTLSIYVRESRRHPKQLLGVFTLWPLGVILQDLMLPLIGSQAINKLVKLYNHGVTANYWHYFTPYLVLFLATGLLGQLITSCALLIMSRLQTSGRQHLERQVFTKLLLHSMDFHNNNFSGSLVNQANRFTNAYVGLSDVFTISFMNLLVKSVIAIAIIAFFAPTIALAMFLWAIVYVCLNVYLTKKRIHLSKTAAEADSVLTGYLADAMGNLGVIKSFAAEKHEQATYTDKSRDRGRKKLAAWTRGIKNGRIIAVMMILIQFIVLVLSIYALMSRRIQLGTLLMIQVYLAQLMGALWNLGSITRTAEQHLSDAIEMTEILNTPLGVKDPATPEKVQITEGAIAFQNMTFRHADAHKENTLFTNFDLTIAPGEKVGLVGHSGSGKTTLTRLLLRFADINQGQICVDGQNIAHIRQDDLRARIAYVPQEPLLFHRTLRENIAYGRPEATDEEVEAAARKAHATEFINKLPLGYKTLVGERGVKLSGGQRQRIAIARAILKDAPILLLDEATSALDSESEKLIQAALWELMKGRTAIVIAHRLSTVQKMDRILVLENGQIVEQGTHKALLKKKGVYAELWTHQSGGFIEE